MEPSDYGFIFDMDGTLVDNLHIHMELWHSLFTEHGVNIPIPELLPRVSGKTNPLILREILGDHYTDEEIREMGDAKERRYREQYAREIKPVPGLLRFLDEVKALGIPMAVATSAPEDNIRLVLDGLGLRPYFRAVVGAQAVRASKPHPDIFLKTAESLGAAPHRCLVFEDALSGLEAAWRGGMRSVAIASSMPETELGNMPGVIEVAKDFTSLDARELVRALDSAR